MGHEGGRVEFRLLGDVEVHVDGHSLDLGHARQQCVLVSLLVDANRIVSVDQLIDRVWADSPPRQARESLHGYISRLRRVMSGAGVAINRQPGGYVLTVDPLAVDLHRFAALMTRAKQAPHHAEAELAEEALALWHGRPFAHLDTPWLNALRESLEGQRTAAELDRNDLALRQGRHAAVLAELAASAAHHPLDERLAGQLTLALYRSGRQADALEHYHRLREHLAEELGIDPSPEMQKLYHQILIADPGLGPPTTQHRGEPAAVPIRRSPAQLPADMHLFTGRKEELTQLDRLLATDGREDAAGSGSTSVPMVAISGTAGVGKTGLAVRWAHQNAGRFPDGQLYVDLRGYDLDQPASPADALTGFLYALGVPKTEIPDELADQAARYRTEVAGRRILIVLDNARTVEQVRPLLPGSPTCVVLVTSRDSLSGLVSRHGAGRLDLDLLPLADSRSLLRQLIGQRVDAEPAAAADLAHLCARLPLALRVAAEFAASRPSVSLAELVVELNDEQRRLDLLDGAGDPRTGVDAVFSWSYRALPADVARFFRLLSLHPGQDLEPYAAAALCETSPETATRALVLLARAHLVQPADTGRYGIHDLLRAYARRLTARHDLEEDRRAATTRLIAFYLDAASAAMDILHPPDVPFPGRQATPGPALPPLGDTQTAHEWLDSERNNIGATCADAGTIGWGRCAIGLATTLARLLSTGDLATDARALDRQARRAGDRRGEARARSNLGLVYCHLGHYAEAAVQQLAARHFAQEITDSAGVGMAEYGLGLVHWHLGEYERAAEAYEISAVNFSESGTKRGVGHALHGLGMVRWRQGQAVAAAALHNRALALFRKGADPGGEGFALHGLGLLHAQEGRPTQAADHYQRALGLFSRNGLRAGEPVALLGLAMVTSSAAKVAPAADLFAQALSLFRQVGDRAGEAEALNALATAALDQGLPDHAEASHQHALSIAVAIGHPYEQARAYDGLAAVSTMRRAPEDARRRWELALEVYKRLNLPEAEAVHAHLASL